MSVNFHYHLESLWQRMTFSQSFVIHLLSSCADFSLHYKDIGFCNGGFSLCSTTDIKDEDTIKVVYVLEPPSVILTLTRLCSAFWAITWRHLLIWVNQWYSASLITWRKPRPALALWIYNSLLCFQYRVSTSVNESLKKDGTLFSTTKPIPLLLDIPRHSQKTSRGYLWVYCLSIKSVNKSGSRDPDLKSSLPQRTRVI